jgi:hypothetical protein
MNLWARIKEIFLPQRADPTESREAREIARRIGERADQLNENLQKYHRSRDPFAAMMADLYNRDQLSRTYRGPDR